MSADKYVECVNNDGFEDVLTVGYKYIANKKKGASVFIVDDNGNERWYGNLKFTACD